MLKTSFIQLPHILEHNYAGSIKVDRAIVKNGPNPASFLIYFRSFLTSGEQI